MPRLLVRFTLRLAILVAAGHGLWHLAVGPIGLLLLAPLVQVLLTAPTMELVAETGRLIRQAAYRSLEGRFDYRGHLLDVHEDDRHYRWLAVGEVQAIVPKLPRAAALRVQYPDRVRLDEAVPGGGRIEAEALVELLGRFFDAEPLRFRTWVQREVVHPAVNIRRRLGIVGTGP